jgi:uncharacterized protein YecE (DUF72 family)
MQNSLFGDDSTAIVAAAQFNDELSELANVLPPNLYLGTSSWHYPGWTGLVWDREYPESTLSRYGLSAYAKHPLFRAVGIDRSFYKPLSIAQFAKYAAQVPAGFRFVVKAPSIITDSLLRDEEGRGRRINDNFLDPSIALRDFIEPALAGLGSKLGALVFQISPLPYAWLSQMPAVIARLHNLLRSIPDFRETAPACAVAVEVRDPQWLIPEFVAALRDAKATYCMGLHAKMPRIADQLPILRALWPGPLVCRWNLNPLHGAYGYEEAEKQYDPYDRIQDPDIETRNALARVIAGTIGAGQNAYVTLSNKAEGSSPLSVIELAKAVRALLLDKNESVQNK